MIKKFTKRSMEANRSLKPRKLSGKRRFSNSNDQQILLVPRKID